MHARQWRLLPDQSTIKTFTLVPKPHTTVIKPRLLPDYVDSNRPNVTHVINFTKILPFSIFVRKGHASRDRSASLCAMELYGGLGRMDASHEKYFFGASEPTQRLSAAPPCELPFGRSAGHQKQKRRRPLKSAPLFSIGGRYKDRTCDPFHVKEVLYR
jgi:hypothetical protein